MMIGLQVGAQTYIPMPADSATWRSRDYDIDLVTHVFDAMLFVRPGDDTVHDGYTYRNVWSRAYRHAVPVGTIPPMTDLDAMYPDTWMTAYREEGRKVYQMLNTGEKLLYDFNAIVGDRIPGAVGWDTVTATDSVLLGGVYHKRYLTTEPDYWVIEGVGSSYGLLPAMNDGTGAYTFICFNQPATSVAYAPDVSVPCTYVYPIHTHTGVASLGPLDVDWSVYPVPASKEVTVCCQNNKVYHATITDLVGRLWWADTITQKAIIDVAAWPRGTYCIVVADEWGNAKRRLIQVN
jgi:hypothetical protein